MWTFKWGSELCKAGCVMTASRAIHFISTDQCWSMNRVLLRDGAVPVSARDSGKSLVDCTISRTRSSYTHSFVDCDSA